MVYKASTENIRYYSKVIALLTFVLLFVITIGATSAWLTAQAIDVVPLTFSRNVEIYITDKTGDIGTEIIVGINGEVLPGQPIKVTNGVVLRSSVVNTKSPDAYVRVKFRVTTPYNIGAAANAIVLTEQPDENVWKLIDFSKKHDGSDMWYVLIDSTTGLAREVKDGEQYNFLNNTDAIVNRELTNEMGGKDIVVEFVAQALQVKNVDNPLLDINNPTWIWYAPVE